MEGQLLNDTRQRFTTDIRIVGGKIFVQDSQSKGFSRNEDLLRI